MVRFKNRYLLCVLEHDASDASLLQQVTSRAILQSVRQSLLSNFGDVGSGHASPALAVKYWSPVLGLALIRASRDHFRSVWAAVTLLTGLDCLPETVTVRFRVVHTGGTIRSCQKEAAEFSRQLILDARDEGGKVDELKQAADGARRELDAMEQ